MRGKGSGLGTPTLAEKTQMCRCRRYRARLFYRKPWSQATLIGLLADAFVNRRAVPIDALLDAIGKIDAVDRGE